MAKINRTLLKEIVKECLVEILLEGIEPSGDLMIESSKRTQRNTSNKIRTNKMAEIQKRRDLLDSKRVDTRSAPPPINENVINGLTDNPLMAEIYKDTANTTLRSQGMSQKAPTKNQYIPGSAEAQAIYDKDPSDLFEGANNWAALAFSNHPKNS